jgi:hypothetical protein
MWPRRNNTWFDVAGLIPVLTMETTNTDISENIEDPSVHYYFRVTAKVLPRMNLQLLLPSESTISNWTTCREPREATR